MTCVGTNDKSQTIRIGLTEVVSGGTLGSLRNFLPCLFFWRYQTTNRSMPFSASFFLQRITNAVVHNIQIWCVCWLFRSGAEDWKFPRASLLSHFGLVSVCSVPSEGPSWIFNVLFNPGKQRLLQNIVKVDIGVDRGFSQQKTNGVRRVEETPAQTKKREIACEFLWTTPPFLYGSPPLSGNSFVFWRLRERKKREWKFRKQSCMPPLSPTLSVWRLPFVPREVTLDDIHSACQIDCL